MRVYFAINSEGDCGEKINIRPNENDRSSIDVDLKNLTLDREDWGKLSKMVETLFDKIEGKEWKE